MSNVVMSVCMMLVLLFLAPLFEHTPLVALSAIIIVAMIGLIEYEEIHHLFRVDKFDFCICMAAFLGVVLFNMVAGLASSVRIFGYRDIYFSSTFTAYLSRNILERHKEVLQYYDIHNNINFFLQLHPYQHFGYIFIVYISLSLYILMMGPRSK